MKRLLNVLIVVLSVVYPLVVYVWIQDASPLLFGAAIAVIASIKFFISGAKTSRDELGLWVAALILSSFIIFSNNIDSIKIYPVLMSSLMATLFAMSLFAEESLVEKMARISGKKISRQAKIYTKRLSLIWAIILYTNALIALYLACFASIQTWALYCGLLSYVFMGIFVLAEIIYRQYYIAKYENNIK